MAKKTTKSKKAKPKKKSGTKKKNGKKKKSVGRPSLFKESFVADVEKLSTCGLTDVELAEYFKVDVSTINNWKKSFPQFFESIKKGKNVADGKVIQSLYNRALGYSHPDVNISNYKGEITVTPIIKHYPPDVASCIFWLINRQRTEWKRNGFEDDGDREQNAVEVRKYLELYFKEPKKGKK